MSKKRETKGLWEEIYMNKKLRRGFAISFLGLFLASLTSMGWAVNWWETPDQLNPDDFFYIRVDGFVILPNGDRPDVPIEFELREGENVYPGRTNFFLKIPACGRKTIELEIVPVLRTIRIETAGGNDIPKFTAQVNSKGGANLIMPFQTYLNLFQTTVEEDILTPDGFLAFENRTTAY